MCRLQMGADLQVPARRPDGHASRGTVRGAVALSVWEASGVRVRPFRGESCGHWLFISLWRAIRGAGHSKKDVTTPHTSPCTHKSRT